MMTRSQGEALCALLGQLRKDWDLPGIRAAIQKAQALGSPSDIATAACRIAGNPQAKSPGLIPHPGTHWQGTAVASRLIPVMCLTHPTEPLGRCKACEAAARDVDHAALAAAARQTLTAAKADYQAAVRQRRDEYNALKEARA